MKHAAEIGALINVLLASKTFHSLVVEGPPGWGKSSTVEKVLREKAHRFSMLGAYSTPLSLFRFLSQNPAGLSVIDDCAGIFGDSIALSILKAATWPSSGTEGTRLVTWGTTADKTSQQDFFYDGKIILLTNYIPKSIEGSAFVSRALHYSLAPTTTDIESLLRVASSSEMFPDRVAAEEAVEFLIANARKADFRGVNLRTLQLGYELATSGLNDWKTLYQRVLPAPDPYRLAYLSVAQVGSVEEQFRAFHRATGLSRRTYYRSRQQP